MAIKEQMNNPKPSQMGGHWKIPKIAVKIAQIR
jgi:hypothetical protein